MTDRRVFDSPPSESLDVTSGPLDAEVVNAFREFFPAEGAAIEPRLRWQLEQNPSGPGMVTLARAGKGGRIVGVMAHVTTRLDTREGQALIADQMVDSFVSPSARGQGVFSRLGEAAMTSAEQRGRAMVWGFPNQSAAPGWFGRLGWSRFGPAPFRIRLLRSGYALRRLGIRSSVLDRAVIRRRHAPAGIEVVKRFGPEFDALWARCSPHVELAVRRDSTFLQWRLIERPTFAYRNVALRRADGSLRAFVSTSVQDKHGGRIAYVMEALAAPEDMGALGELLRFELGEAAARGAEVALAWNATDAFNRKAYRRAGFLPFPERLRPVDIHLGGRRLVQAEALSEERARALFVSYCDSDTV